jgi:hypothetical protein
MDRWRDGYWVDIYGGYDESGGLEGKQSSGFGIHSPFNLSLTQAGKTNKHYTTPHQPSPN